MRITTKGQVTIPQSVRDFAGFRPGDEVDFVIGEDGVVRVLPAGQGVRHKASRLQSVIDGLRGSGTGGISRSW